MSVSADRTGNSRYKDGRLSFGLWHVERMWANLLPLKERGNSGPSFTLQLEDVEGTGCSYTLASWWVAEQDYDALNRKLTNLKVAVRPVLSAYRSEPADITEEQITKAWEAFDG